MKKLLLALVVAVSTLSFAQKADWVVDQSHSSINFSIGYLGISSVTGKYERFAGTASSPSADNFDNGSVDFTIEAESINTDNKDRDNHLKGPDFFNVQKFPKSVFKSTSLKKVNGKEYKLNGDFTMKGVKKGVSLTAIFNGTAKGMKGETRAGFTVTGDLNRADWGVNYGIGDMVIGDVVKFTANISLVKK